MTEPDRPVLHRGAWVLPIVSEAVRDGAVCLAGGAVAGTGPAEEILAAFPTALVIEHPRSILMPPLVNAHVHLGLTGEAGRHPGGEGLFPWLSGLVPALRKLDAAAAARATAEGAEKCWRMGTGLVGEIAGLDGVEAGLRAHPHLQARVYFEVLGVGESAARAALARALDRVDGIEDPTGRLRPGLSPHAPYSLWPPLWPEVVGAAVSRGLPWTTHLAEPPEENEFLLRGTGGVRDFLEAMDVWDEAFPVPGMTGAAFLLDRDLVDDRGLLVHGVHLHEAEIERLAVNDAAVCLCPRSNAHLGLPPAPVEALYHGGVMLCMGTDSLASNRDLGVWGELRAVHALAPGLSPTALVRMATANGAMALGFTGRAGTLHPGGPARLIAVDAPDLGRDDPHRYLVEAAVEDRVRWLAPA